MKFYCYLILTLTYSLVFSQNDLRSIYNAGIEAYKSQDYEAFLYHFQRADSLSPNHPTITYNLAAAYSRNNIQNKAFEYLKKAILMNGNFKPEEDEDFLSLKSLEAFNEILNFRKELVGKVEGSLIAFTNSDKSLHPESVAYDPKSKDFFLNSVRQGKIVRYKSENKVFADFATGLWSVMGMKTNKNSLWVCTVATSEYKNFSEENEGKTALVQFDIKTGNLINRYELSGGHWFGDLVFSNKGDIYVSDSQTPIIYRLEEDGLVVFQDFSKSLFNLQGLDFSDDESTLYISDYKLGIHAFDMQEEKLTKLTFPDHLITKGIDGLYYYNNSLIGVHNGVNPFRVAQYYLDKSGMAIIDHKYLDKARDELNEPTLGVLVKGSFYYVANSPWGAYKDGEFDQSGLGDNIIFRYDLE